MNVSETQLEKSTYNGAAFLQLVNLMKAGREHLARPSAQMKRKE